MKGHLFAKMWRWPWLFPKLWSIQGKR